MDAKVSVVPDLHDGVLLDPIDRDIIIETQGGLPLVPKPYHAVAEKLGLDVTVVMERIRAMQQSGAIRRIGAVPNHYALGYKANGMAVWDVIDEQVDTLGRIVGRLNFVSHCYRRPRCLPEWPYNLFVMVHGRSHDEVEEKVAEIAQMLATNCRAHDLLYSTKILKKTGLRLS